jgi:hypothetical protein
LLLLLRLNQVLHIRIVAYRLASLPEALLTAGILQCFLLLSLLLQ